MGSFRIRVALELFDSIVALVYRFGLGVWGVSVRHVRKLDDLFADLVRWLFRFPRTTGWDVILSNFGRRCAKCDSIFLAAVQLARADGTRNIIWADTVRDLTEDKFDSLWFEIVRSELDKRGFKEEVLNRGGAFLGDRKRRAVEFSQYCYHSHLNVPTGTSADQIKRRSPFRIFPFLFQLSPKKTRYIFSFLCSVWRFIDDCVCRKYPELCQQCDMENSSLHVLFVCPVFDDFCAEFLNSVGAAFSLDILASEDHDTQKAISSLGVWVFNRIADRCRSRLDLDPPSPQSN